MHFKSSYEVSGLRANLDKTSEIEMKFDLPIQARLLLSVIYPDGSPTLDASSVVCTATTEGEIPDNQATEDLHLALLNSTDGVWPNFKGKNQEEMAHIWRAVDSFFIPLSDLIQSTTSILRWRFGSTRGPVYPYQNVKQALSEDGESWFLFHAARSVNISMLPSVSQFEITPDIEREVTKLVVDNREEPLGHQLLREARNQARAHSRSALVIGVAAAEVGLKKLIGVLVPQNQWLLEEIETPSLSKILRKYLPQLPVKLKFTGKTIAPPNQVIRKLERAAELRNKIVHAGKEPPNTDELDDLLDAIQDFLWICDLYAGNAWAGTYISHATMQAWKNEDVFAE